MKNIKEKQKIEAIKRMEALNLMDEVIKDFEEKNILYRSEYGGILYWLNDEQKKLVTDFETKHNATVYHVIHSNTGFGELLSFLYVSNHTIEWGYDNDDIKQGYVLAYVKNINDDICSEFGSIGIRPQVGGLVRTY